MATATYVSSASALAGSVSVPGGSAGDIVVAWGVDIASPPDASWTQRQDVPGFGLNIRVWTKTRTASEGSTYTFGGVGGAPNLCVMVVSGALEPPAGIDWDQNTNGTAVCESLTAPAQGGILLCWFAVSGGTLTGTPAGMTERINLNSSGVEVWTQGVSSGATGTRSNTLSGSAFWLTMPVLLASDPDHRGAFAASQGAASGALTGAPTATGALAATAGGANASLSGSPTAAGAFAAAAGGSVAALSGAPTATGALAAAAGGATAELTSSSTISGSFAAEAGGAAAGLTGAPVASGAFGATAGASVAALAGEPTIVGSFGAVAAAFVSALAGTPEAFGAFAAAMGGAFAAIRDGSAGVQAVYRLVTGRRNRGGARRAKYKAPRA